MKLHTRIARLGVGLLLGAGLVATGCERGAEPGATATGAAAPAAAGSTADPAIAWWTCPMHTSVHAPHAGQCPICGMTLVPVSREAVESGEVRIDAERREKAGIRSEPVARGPLALSLRLVGRVATDETSLVDVSARVGGWITQLDVAALGAPVRKGEVLFRLYSPELLAAQQELLQAIHSQREAASGSLPERADPLVRAARKRLELWGIAGGDVDAVVARGQPLEALPIRSPASGYVIEKDVVDGAAIEAGARLYRIASSQRIWIDAAIPESDLALVSVGQAARVSVPSLAGESLAGSIAHVYPTLDPDTRTGRVRIELPNPGDRLRPDMWANVELAIDKGERLLVPVSAVLYAGPRRIVFVDAGENRLVPRTLEIGAGNGEFYEVLAGLEPGERVVTSGNFLVAAESRLASALVK